MTTNAAPASTVVAAPAAVARQRRARLLRTVLFATTIGTVQTILFALPWWTIVIAPAWSGVTIAATAAFLAAFVAFPVLMYLGHGRRHWDWAAVAGDTLLGVIWILFAWSALSGIARLVLVGAGVADPVRSRALSLGVVAVSLVLIAWGFVEALRVPRVKRVDVRISRLGRQLDGVRVVVITDTHYGPVNRLWWSRRVVEVINEIDPDIVCHTGDIADGSVTQRREQAAPLGAVRANLAKTYVTGNHEYFGQAQGWVDFMTDLGWQALRNRHIVVERGGDALVIAGVDDITAAGSGQGHQADHQAALAGVDPDLPVLLLAHQPKHVSEAVSHGVDLQVSGHTHGGQIWPFHYLVRLDQPVVRGLSRHGERTQLYTSAGAGFWGPPLRVFAPSEITVLTLRAV